MAGSEAVEYTHCKTQLVDVITKETVPGDYEWVPNYLTDQTAITAAMFSVPSLGLAPMAMQQAKNGKGKLIWQAVWAKPADAKFPLKGTISFEYKSSLGDKGERKIESGEVDIKYPSVKEAGGCCVLM